MGILRNNTERLIMIDGKPLIPGRSAADIDVVKVKKLYPEAAEMLANGELTEITQAQAKAIENSFEELKLNDLKDYAKEQGINIEGLTKKADILSVIRAAKDKRFEGK